MITRLHVSNYRSLDRDVSVDLGALTVLVGQNGSGKSNVADVLQFLADCMHIGLESAITKRHGINAVRRWSSGRPFNVTIAVAVGRGSVHAQYEFTLAGDRAEEYRVKAEKALVTAGGTTHEYSVEAEGDGVRWASGPENLRPKVDRLNLVLPLVAGDERFGPLAEELRRVATYCIYPDALRQPQKYDPSKPMDRHGSNWVSILKDQPPDTWRSDLVTVLGQLTGDIVDVRTRAVGGYLNVEFEHKSEPKRPKWFEAALESDGTLRVAGMITALRQQPAPSLIALEEPELTVHPGALKLLYDYVREAADATQVVLTTHSPDLLELLTVDQVRVVERHGGATTVQPLEESQRRVVEQGLFSLGEVLRSEGLQQQQLRLVQDWD
jgi:predicted ATPase